MSEFSFWLAVGIFLMAVGLWVFTYRKIRRNTEDYASRRKVAGRVMALVAISIAVAGIGRWLNIEEPVPVLIVIICFFAIIMLISGIIEWFSAPHGKPETPHQYKWMMVAIAGMTSPIWLGIPYVTLVYLPSLGINAAHAVIIAIVLASVAMLIDLINFDG